MAVYAYQSTVLQGTTKTGKIKCSPDGYYDVIAGGFDTYNSAGAFYTWSSAKSIFDKSSHFMRRVGNGALYGEDGHPTMVPGMTPQQWLTRIYTIDHDRCSHHIKELWFDDTTFKNKDNDPMITVFMRVKPSGVRAQILGDSLDNENENTAFSIRSITDDFVDPRTGIRIKNMREIITYDRVFEPGIDKATKMNNPALENMDLEGSYNFSDSDIIATIDYAKSFYGAFEDNGVVDGLERLLEKQAPAKPTGLVFADPTKPLSSQW